MPLKLARRKNGTAITTIASRTRPRAAALRAAARSRSARVRKLQHLIDELQRMFGDAPRQC